MDTEDRDKDKDSKKDVRNGDERTSDRRDSSVNRDKDRHSRSRSRHSRRSRSRSRSRRRSPSRNSRKGRSPSRSRSRSRGRRRSRSRSRGRYDYSRSRSRSRGGRRGYPRPSSRRQKGTCCRWQDRGFCFIKPFDGGEDVFCHVSAIMDGNYIPDRAEVEFHTVVDERTGRLRAAEVTGGAYDERMDGPPRPSSRRGGRSRSRRRSRSRSRGRYRSRSRGRRGRSY